MKYRSRAATAGTDGYEPMFCSYTYLGEYGGRAQETTSVSISIGVGSRLVRAPGIVFRHPGFAERWACLSLWTLVFSLLSLFLTDPAIPDREVEG